MWMDENNNQAPQKEQEFTDFSNSSLRKQLFLSHHHLHHLKKEEEEEMTSMPCSFHLQSPQCSSSCLQKLRKPFVGGNRNGVLGSFRPQRIGLRIVPTPYSRAKCWFRFGKNGVDAEGAGIYGSQTRDDFDRDDVEQYFNYMGMLAVEGSYGKMDALLRQSIHPVDILLMMAASEGDKPKIEELLRAGANYDVKDEDGRTALDRAANEEIKEYILGFSIQNA